MDVVIWRFTKVPHAANLYELKGLEKSFRLSKGVPLQDGFPSSVAFHMNPDFPDDLVLPDSTDNVKDALLVSERLHRFLAAAALPKVEFLPVSVIDHKGRVASSQHVIVHPIEPVACVDLQASVYSKSEIVADKLQDVQKLVLDPDRLPKDRLLFKVLGLTRAVFVRRELAQAITAQGFTGVGWTEVGAFRN
jgi:hypothetical protein